MMVFKFIFSSPNIWMGRLLWLFKVFVVVWLISRVYEYRIRHLQEDVDKLKLSLGVIRGNFKRLEVVAKGWSELAHKYEELECCPPGNLK